MSADETAAGTGGRRMLAVTVVAAVSLGFLAFALSASADVGTVSGSAYGASGTVTVDDFDSSTPPNPAILEPAPTLTLHSTGGHVTASAPSTSFGPGSVYLSTGLLTVSSQGTTGTGGSSSTTASVDDVDAMGYLTASNVSSTCTASETGLQAWTAISPDGRLVLDEATTIPLIANPSPNERYHGVTSSGETYTVILNEQTYTTNSITVTAVHIILEGPTTTGHIYLGQSHCDVTVVESTTSTMPWETEPSSTSSSTSTPLPSSTSTSAAASSSTSSSTSTSTPLPSSTSTSSSTTTTVVPGSTCANGRGPVRRPLPPAAGGSATPQCPRATA